MKNKTTIKPMDERQKQIQTQAMAWGYVFLCLSLLIAMIVRFVRTEEAGWEFFILNMGCIVVFLARRILGDVEQPKNLAGKPLPTGSSKKDRAARVKDYALGSCIFAGVFAMMDILLVAFSRTTSDLEVTEFLFPSLDRGLVIGLSAVVAFLTMFLISFVFTYFISENFKVKRYNKMLAELDED